MNHATKKELIAISSAVLRVFFATMIAQIIASGVGILDTDGDAWRTYANSGISSAILVLYAYLIVVIIPSPFGLLPLAYVIWQCIVSAPYS